jgi:hypothetical protein
VVVENCILFSIDVYYIMCGGRELNTVLDVYYILHICVWWRIVCCSRCVYYNACGGESYIVYYSWKENETPRHPCSLLLIIQQKIDSRTNGPMRNVIYFYVLVLTY